MEALAALHAGTLRATPQDDAAATYAPMIRKADGAIDWTLAAHDDRPPGARVQSRGRRRSPRTAAGCSKIHRARALAEASAAAPGTVLALGDAIRVATGAGVLGIEELQLEGKRALPARAFARGGGARRREIASAAGDG